MKHVPTSAPPAPSCPPPDPHPRAPSRFEVPEGAVDCHAHVIGQPWAHPFVNERSYTPPAASEAATSTCSTTPAWRTAC